MLTCEEFESMIDAYLDDDLTKDQKEQFSEHISSCDKCKDALAFAKGVRDTLSTLPSIEVPSDFSEKIHKRIEKDGKKQLRTITYLRRYGALAACLVLAVVVAMGPEITDFTNENDDPLTNIHRVISSPVPATISEDIEILTPEVSPKVKVAEKSPTPVSEVSEEATPSLAPASIPNENTEPEITDSGIAPANLEKDVTTRAYDPEISEISVLVKADDIEKAKELSSLFAYVEDDTYTLDKASFELLKEAFSDNGIAFSITEEPKNDIIKFTISE